MAVYQITGPDGGIYEIEAPDTASESDVLAYAQQQFGQQKPAAPSETAEQAGARYRGVFGGGTRNEGRANLPSAAQGGFAALQGPLFGFADEIAGAGGAVAGLTRGDLNVAQNYRDARDFWRGANDQAQQERPVLTPATQFAASMLPAALGGANPLAAPSAAAVSSGRTASVGGNMVRAGASAAASGAVNSAGMSEAGDLAGILRDAGQGGAVSGAFGMASVPAAMVASSGKRVIGAAFNRSTADDYARQKIAEALLRDAQGEAFQAGQLPVGGGVYKVGESSPIDQARARLGKLGDDAALVDAGRENAADLLDNVANLPGRSKNMLERFKTARIASRGERMAGAADDALGVAGTYSDDIGGFVAQREMNAAPLYTKAEAEAPPIVIPKDILLRDSVKSAYKKAQDMAAEKGITLPPMNERAVQPIPPLSLKQADFLKRAMDDVLYGAKMPDSNVGKNAYRLMEDTRAALVSSIDEQAGPAYAQARAAFAGPTRAIEAAEAGRSILKEDALAIPDLIRGMGDAEREAFKIGVAQAIREKAGTMGGQNALLRLWREPATADKLKAVFGGDYRKFQAAMLAEKTKKGVEELGKANSRTFRREAANEDLGQAVIEGAAGAANEVRGGNVIGAFGLLKNAANRLQTPELTRERIARILLSQGPQARSELDQLVQTLMAVQRGKAGLATGYGIAAGGVAAPVAVQPRPPIH